MLLSCMSFLSSQCNDFNRMCCCLVAGSCQTLLGQREFLCPGDSPKQEYWSVLPFPSPGDLPHRVIETVSPGLAGRFFTTESPLTDFRTALNDLEIFHSHL